MFCLFFFFKQKTAYEMRISDWSSDVCSSDLVPARRQSACADRLDSGGFGMGFDILRRGAGHRSSRAAVLTAAMLGAALMAGALPAVGAEQDAAQRPLLVPRAPLFASPAHSELQIRPDGRQLAFLPPLHGVLNVWVAPLVHPKAATP